MIYTLTLNPSIDYVVTTDKFNIGETNRTRSEMSFPGGKGINVSIVLNSLGIKSTALAFVAGYTGREIQRKIGQMGLPADFVTLEEGDSRINVKIRLEGGNRIISETELNGAGPEIKDSDIQKLYKKLDGLKDNDILIMSGSAPASLGKNIYADICGYFKKNKKGTIVAVDATGTLLTNTLAFNPFLIKPNIHELEDIFDTRIDTEEQIIEYAKKLQESGAVNVLVSAAGDGALLLTENGSVFTCKAPKGRVCNSVGAGDSMVAGFMAVIAESLQVNDSIYKKALEFGVCSGSASAFSEGLADRDRILELYRQFSGD